jgi:hypothetical protein
MNDRFCPDGGKCHHSCAIGCFRVETCEPLSGIYPGDEWPTWLVNELPISAPPLVAPLEDLILDSPGARNTDPHTSHEAAAEQTPRKNGPIHAAVLLYLWANPDSIDDDLHDAIGGPDSTPRKRRGELRDAGLIEVTGEGVSRYGKHALRWSLNKAGLDYVTTHTRELIELRDQRRKLR